MQTNFFSDESNKGRVSQVARHQVRMGDGEEGDGNQVKEETKPDKIKNSMVSLTNHTGCKSASIIIFSSIILQFSAEYLRRVPLRQYRLWEGLGKRYETNVTVLNEAESKALIRLPEGKYSDLQLKAILRYRMISFFSGFGVCHVHGLTRHCLR